MTDTQKLVRLKALLNDENIPSDETLMEYIVMSGEEILNWLYIRKGSVPANASIPAMYENVQVMAVVAAINIMGAEGESLHIENGTHRQFRYDDMVAYIRAHVHPLVVM